MKKIIVSMLLILSLLLAAGACAEDPYVTVSNALYRIVLRTEQGDTPLGTGVVFMSSDTLLTVQACNAQGELIAIGADGEHRIVNRLEVDDSGAVLLAMDPPASVPALTLSDYSVYALPQVFGMNDQGEWLDTDLYQVTYTLYKGQEALVFAAEEGLMPGAVVADQKGALVGVTVAQNGEGMGMYTALDADALTRLLTGKADPDHVSSASLQYSWKDGALTITWPEDDHTDGIYALVVSGEGNRYYTSYKTKGLERSIEITPAPGHTYNLLVQWMAGKDAELNPSWNDTVVFTAPAEPFTGYGFTQECYLATAPAGEEISDVLSPVQAVSPQQLLDSANTWYLQVINRYDVSQPIELPMTVELIAPDQQFFYIETGYLFDEEYEEHDAFCIDLTELVQECVTFSGKSSLQEGTYTLRYAIGGKIAGECTFAVREDAQAADPAQEGQAMEKGAERSRQADKEEPVQEIDQAQAGFVTDVQVQSENGLITLDWSQAADLPQGDVAYTAFIQYEGNTYYTYHEMLPGAMETSFFTLPDRWCAVWVVWTRSGSATELYPQEESQYFLLDAGLYIPTFDTLGFRHVRCSLTNAQVQEGVYLPEMEITRQNLAGGQVCFQTHDTYAADASSEEHPLVIALYTPEGYVFIQEGYYSFMPELSGGDIWATDISDILGNYDAMTGGRTWPSGDYAIGYYIDGCEAGRITFTLP